MVAERLKPSDFEEHFENNLDMMVVVDLAGVFVRANRAYLDALGYQEDEVVGQAFPRFVHPEDLPGTFAEFERFIRSQEVTQFVVRSRTATGDYVLVEWRGYLSESGLIFSVGRAVADPALGVVDGDADGVEAGLLRSLEALNQFAYVVAHDLRTPLRGIRHLSQWISEAVAGKVDDEVDSFVRLLESRVDRLETLLDGLNGFVRTGVLRAVIERIDLAALLSEILAELRSDPRLADKANRLELDAVGDLPVVETARTPLRHCLSNLIANACRHHDGETCAVAVRVASEPRFWRIDVIDDGPGIPERFQQQIFEPFSTLEPKDEIESAGMGLAIVSRILSVCNGRIEVESPVADGRGSRFRVFWPKQWPRAIAAEPRTSAGS